MNWWCNPAIHSSWRTCAVTPADVEAAVNAGADGLNMYIGTSDVSRSYNHGQGLEEIGRRSLKLIEETHRNYPDLILRFSGEDAFRTQEEDLFSVYDNIAPFVSRFGTPDTVGVATPTAVARRIQLLRQRYPQRRSRRSLPR